MQKIKEQIGKIKEINVGAVIIDKMRMAIYGLLFSLYTCALIFGLLYPQYGVLPACDAYNHEEILSEREAEELYKKAARDGKLVYKSYIREQIEKLW